MGDVQIQRAAVGDEAVGLRRGAGNNVLAGAFVGIPETGGDLNAGDAS